MLMFIDAHRRSPFQTRGIALRASAFFDLARQDRVQLLVASSFGYDQNEDGKSTRPGKEPRGVARP